jgi:hypothetical protein
LTKNKSNVEIEEPTLTIENEQKKDDVVTVKAQSVSKSRQSRARTRFVRPITQGLDMSRGYGDMETEFRYLFKADKPALINKHKDDFEQNSNKYEWKNLSDEKI